MAVCHHEHHGAIGQMQVWAARTRTVLTNSVMVREKMQRAISISRLVALMLWFIVYLLSRVVYVEAAAGAVGLSAVGADVRDGEGGSDAPGVAGWWRPAAESEGSGLVGAVGLDGVGVQLVG